MRPAVVRTLLLLVGLGMVTTLALELRVGTNVTHFMPSGSESSLAVLSGRLADSELTRTMVLSIEAGDPTRARAAAMRLARSLERHPEVAWVRTGIESDRMRELFELYFPRRHYFLSPDPERDVPARLEEAALRARARDALRRLSQPSSTLLEELIASDPIGAFEGVLARFRDNQPAMTVTDGQFTSADGRYAIVLLGTHHSAFDSGAQAPLLDAFDRHIGELRSEDFPELRVEASGANRFAVSAERSIKRDVQQMVAVSVGGILVLFLAFVGSMRSFLLIVLPTAGGMITATFAGLLVFGGLDGLTMAFGVTLMGVAVDYAIHLVIHQAMDAGDRRAAETARTLRPTLLLGAITTIASFAGLGVTAFPAFREMAFFAITGVATSVALTLWVLPGLLDRAPRVPARSRALASLLTRRVMALDRHPSVLLSLTAVALVLAPFALPQLRWVDDLSRLSRFDPELQAEDRRVRERISQFDMGRLVIGLAPDDASAVVLDEQIQRRLARSVDAGHLDGVRSLHALLWSPDLQRANQAALARQPDVAARVEAAYVAEGFRPGAFRPFADALAAGPPPPLTLADLRQSPVGDLVSTLVVPLGDEVGVLTYLRGVHDAGAIAAALADLPNVHLFDQRTFLDEIYAEFRESTLRQMLVGSALVVLALVVRYRRVRPALAAFLPSALVALFLLEGFALAGVETNLFHVMSLVMVMGMGVDYGVFVVDAARRQEDPGPTLLSLVVACFTTVFVFGILALSEQPALNAIGVTTGAGILLSLLLAPLARAVLPGDVRRP